MKSASTDDRTDIILYDVIQGSRQHPVCIVEYEDDYGVWQQFDDLLSVNINKNSQDSRYGSFSLLPETGEISLSFDNSQEKYSPGTGNEFDGILIRNRKVRASLGYALQEAISKSLSLNVTSYQKQLYHTQIIGSSVFNSITNTGGAASLLGITFSMYGTYLYGGGTYGIDGYYLTDPIDTYANRVEVLQTLSVTSDTNKIKLYYRHANTQAKLALQSFAYAGATVNGTTAINFPDTDDRYIQFAFIWEVGAWSSTTGYITGLAINYTDTAEYFSQGIFLLDDPSFNSSSGAYTASVSGRDYLKKSYETQMSLPTIYGEDVMTIVRWVCDRAQIPYTNTTLPLLSSPVTIADADNFKDVSARDILDECIAYATGVLNTDYRLIMNDDGNLELILIPSNSTTADYVMDYRSNIFSLSKGYTQNNLLQRITVMQKEHTVAAETLLASATYTAVGVETLSWSNESIYKRIEVEYNNSSSDAKVEIAFVRNTYITFTISGATLDVDIKIYGDELAATPPFCGEWIVDKNHVISKAKQFDAGLQLRNGFTHKLLNRFVFDDISSETMALNYGTRFGNRLYELSINGVGNPLVEINDKVLVFEKYTNSQSIFVLTGISHSFSADGAEFKSSFKFVDYGFTLANFIWDLNGATEGAGDFKWDTGYLWDIDLGYANSDTTDYSSTKRVKFS
jgi:hypothetical protein